MMHFHKTKNPGLLSDSAWNLLRYCRYLFTLYSSNFMPDLNLPDLYQRAYHQGDRHFPADHGYYSTQG